MDWFGFGFNVFGQILCDNNEKLKRDQGCTVKVLNPTNIKDYVDASSCQQDTNKRINISLIRASWSRRVSLYSEDDGAVCLSGFGSGVTDAGCHGCKDAQISEEYVTLAFPDRIESWKTGNNDKTPVWSMDMKTQSEESETSLYLPLVPGGYIAAKPPLYRPISPQLKAVRLALGAEHALLLSATGAMYTWGSGSHGQLGHEVLSSEQEPRAVEALWGLPMSFVAAGGWHSACISAGGDLYVWGWNKNGQLGLPSQSLRKEQHGRRQRSELCQDASTSTCDETQEGGKQSDVFISIQDASTSTCDETQEGGNQSDVFISIQAFPALLDIDPPCEVTKVSCGSRHTAAVTDTGYLYTWGWGDYGQLGHKTTLSSDEPQHVDFFKEKGLRVVDVVCGAWNTFAAAINEEVVTS